MQVKREFEDSEKQLVQILERMPINELKKSLGLELEKEQKIKPQPSKWAALSQRVKENPISLGDYAKEDERIRREFRENFTFNHDH